MGPVDSLRFDGVGASESQCTDGAHANDLTPGLSSPLSLPDTGGLPLEMDIHATSFARVGTSGRMAFPTHTTTSACRPKRGTARTETETVVNGQMVPAADSLLPYEAATEDSKNGLLAVAAGGLAALDLFQRAEAMFFGAADLPTATGDGGAAAGASLAVIAAVDDARMAFWKARTAALKQRFAPELVDKEDIFGYMLADVLGRPVLAHADAKAVGKRGDNAAAKAKKERKTAEAHTATTVRVARDSGSETLIAEAMAAREEAIATRLAMLYDLKLPAYTVGRKRKVEPSPLSETAAGGSAQPQAQLALRRAEGAAAKAEAEVERMQRRVEAVGHSPTRPSGEDPAHTWRTYERNLSELQQARGGLQTAERHLGVKRDESDAWLDELDEVTRASEMESDALESARIAEQKRESAENRQLRRDRMREVERYFELGHAWRHSAAHSQDSPWVVLADWGYQYSTDTYTTTRVVGAWPMVAGTGIGPPPYLPAEQPSYPELPPWCFPTYPPWVEMCKRRGINPETSPMDPVFD